MALDLSIGFSQAEVEALFAKQKKLLLKLTVQFSDSGSTVTYRAISDCEKIIKACQTALAKMDPATYGEPSARVKKTEVEDFDL
ncbi:MAG: hypothetical protein GY811_05945 [Myxococcales bacterium]|nr:hypothetical protein [Myxococcales bacterium]